MIDDGEDPDAYLDELIEVDNAVLDRAQGRGVTVGMHMCRGNNRSAWHAEGSYEAGGGEGVQPAATSTASCWSTTRSAPAASSRCASCRRTRWSCWA